MSNKFIFVFERTNENSLLAAAVLKKFGNLKIMEVEQVDKEIFEDIEAMYWLGFQPLEFLARKIRCDHIAFIPKSLETPNAPNVTINTGDYETITQQIFTEVLMPQNDIFQIHDVVRDLWIGYAYRVEQFHKKTPARELTLKGKVHVINDFTSIQIAYNVIRMAFDYVFHNKPWRDAISAVDHDYMEAVEETKHLLSHFSQTDYSSVQGQIVGSQLINITDYHLYIAKRLVILSGQIFKTSRIIGQRIHFASNAMRRLAA